MVLLWVQKAAWGECRAFPSACKLEGCRTEGAASSCMGKAKTKKKDRREERVGAEEPVGEATPEKRSRMVLLQLEGAGRSWLCVHTCKAWIHAQHPCRFLYCSFPHLPLQPSSSSSCFQHGEPPWCHFFLSPFPAPSSSSDPTSLSGGDLLLWGQSPAL